MLKDYSCFHIQEPLWNNPVKYYRDPAWLTRKLLLLLRLDHHPLSFLWIALEIWIPHNLSHLSNLTSSQSQPCSRGHEVVEIRITLNKVWQDSQNKRDHVNLSSPNLAACGPRVCFVWMLKGLWKHKVTEVQLCPDTHTHWLAEVMTSHRSVGEKKNNELTMTHRTHMSFRARSHTHTNS